MATAEQRAEKNRASFRRYYDENRDDYNARRRDKYAQDKETREKARERAREYRASKPVVERQLTRVLNGRNVKVYSTGQIAQEMDRTPQMLRNWDKLGLIPESVFPDKHRLYTAKQKRMIIRLGEVIAENGGALAAIPVSRFVAKMKKRW